MNPEFLIFELGRMKERSDAAFRKKREGGQRRLLDRVAAQSRWFLIRMACDTRVARQEPGQPTDRSLPDLKALFADNAAAIADAWKLGPADPRREPFIKAITRRAVTSDTRAVAERYLQARLSGASADDAREQVEGWSRFRP